MAASDALETNPIYVEIGGNIGTCVMEMLLATDAHVVVFEPLPKNVALLAQALLLNEASLRNWVKLYPIALGDYPRKSIVTRIKNNSAKFIEQERERRKQREVERERERKKIDELEMAIQEKLRVHEEKKAKKTTEGGLQTPLQSPLQTAPREEESQAKVSLSSGI